MVGFELVALVVGMTVVRSRVAVVEGMGMRLMSISFRPGAVLPVGAGTLCVLVAFLVGDVAVSSRLMRLSLAGLQTFNFAGLLNLRGLVNFRGDLFLSIVFCMDGVECIGAGDDGIT